MRLFPQLFFTLLLLSLMSESSYAQCFILKVSFDDCQSCRGILTSFDPQKTGLPAYVVFPTKSLSDSSEIQFLGRFEQSGMKAIYDDSWYNKMKDCKSCVVGLNKHGKIAYNSLLSELRIDSFQEYIANNKSTKMDKHVQFFEQRDTIKYVFDIGLGSLKIINNNNGDLIGKIRSSDMNLGLLGAKMSGGERFKFQKYGFALNRGSSELAAKFKSFQIAPNGDIFMSYQYHNTPDSLTNNITDEICIVQYSSLGQFKDIFLVRQKKDMVLYDFSFLLENSKSIYINACSSEGFQKDLESGIKRINYIAHFLLKNGIFEFEKFVPLDIPYIHKTKYFENDLSSNLSCFPYVANYLSNEVYDIYSGRKMYIINDSIYKKGILEDEANSFTEPFHCYGVKFNTKHKELILAYKLGDNTYINWYSKDLLLLRSRCLDFKFTKLGQVRFVNMNLESNLLEIIYANQENDLQTVAVPLDLYNI